MNEGDVPEDPAALGALGGHLSMAPLMTAVAELAESTREQLRILLAGFARRHIAEWNALVSEVHSGAVDQRSRRVPGSAFRPNFHAHQAQEHFKAERWTESFSRFVNAGEVLLGQVFLPALKAAGLSVEAGKPGWFTAFERWARKERLDLDSNQEFQEFKRIYGIRSRRIAHGQHEATLAEAMEAKRAYEGLRRVLQERFASKYGLTLDALQHRSLHARSMLWEQADIERVLDLVEQAHQLIDGARSELLRLVDQHIPRYPLVIRQAMDDLTGPHRAQADRAFEAAMQDDFDLVRQIWIASTDGNRLLGDVIEEIVDEERGS
ncbi:MAG: hypothetical protein M3O70_26675 [Actinomycetota bacterium]|nr:hypothetical protein [Actinomycetota bacterium]